mgnify:FL=1|jgi:hypothetical protein
MRRRWLILPALVLAGCPSLDGFTGTGKSDASTPSGKGFLSLENAARLCSRVQTCPHLGFSLSFSLLLPIDGTTYSTCIDLLSAPVPSTHLGIDQQSKALKCAAEATNCLTAGACLPYEYMDPADPRCQGSDGGVDGDCSPDKKSVYECNFNRVTHCDSPYFYPGSTCLLNSTGQYRCAASQTCTTTESVCTGSVVSFCTDGNLSYGEDCAYWGSTCGKDQASGNQDCILNGLTPFCSTNAVQCVGDRVRACVGGFYGEIDCAAVGGKCNAKPTAHCTRPPLACDLGDQQIDTCAGDGIKLCVGSKPQTFDCTSIGMTCQSGAQGAYCG